ncbi:hypothetical protein SRHO_G00184650 [Serrasalmus rhombeus]
MWRQPHCSVKESPRGFEALPERQRALAEEFMPVSAGLRRWTRRGHHHHHHQQQQPQQRAFLPFVPSKRGARTLSGRLESPRELRW